MSPWQLPGTFQYDKLPEVVDPVQTAVYWSRHLETVSPKSGSPLSIQYSVKALCQSDKSGASPDKELQSVLILSVRCYESGQWLVIPHRDTKHSIGDLATGESRGSQSLEEVF